MSWLGILACSRADTRSNQDRISRATTTVGADAARIPLPAPPDTDDFGAPLPRDAALSARVVSLNPAATEVIFAMGAEAHLVGRSAWDEFPAAAKTVPSLGDGIRPNVEAVLRARPTLVILYATAENRAAADAFQRAGVRTITLRVDHIAQFVTLTQRLGVALGAEARAQVVADTVQRTLDAVRAATRAVTRTVTAPSVAWPLWQQPVMVVGRGSYLDELLEIAGARNVFHDLDAPSPTVSVEEIARRNPDALVVSARSATELRNKPQWRAVAAVRNAHFLIDNPQLTGRPSVVLGMAAVSLARALHPELADKLPALPAVVSGVPR